MEKSIEQIWKDGFMENKELKVPKINAIYNQKSKHIVERLLKNMQTELVVIIMLGFVGAIVSTIAGNTIWWGITPLLISSLWFFIGKKQLLVLKKTKFHGSCYDYLVEINKKIKRIARINERNTILSIPLILFPMLVYTYYNNPDKTIGQIFGIDSDLSKSYMFLLIPIVMLLAFGFYRLFLKINNRIGNKIEALIADMQELRG